MGAHVRGCGSNCFPSCVVHGKTTANEDHAVCHSGFNFLANAHFCIHERVQIQKEKLVSVPRHYWHTMLKQRRFNVDSTSGR